MEIYIYILKVCNIILRKILSLKIFFFLFPVWLYILHFAFLYLLSTLYIYISLSLHLCFYICSLLAPILICAEEDGYVENISQLPWLWVLVAFGQWQSPAEDGGGQEDNELGVFIALTSFLLGLWLESSHISLLKAKTDV